MARDASWECGGKKVGLFIVNKGTCVACRSESNFSSFDLFSTALVSLFPRGLRSACLTSDSCGGEDI